MYFQGMRIQWGSLLFALVLVACVKSNSKEGEVARQEQEVIEGEYESSVDTTNEEMRLVKDTLTSLDLDFSGIASSEVITITGPSLVVVTLDSFELELLKALDEDVFYTAADDLMWYHAGLVNQLDSTNIPIRYSKSDTLEVLFKDERWTIVKDGTYSIYTYFEFNGQQMVRTDLFDLLGY